jgi:hypothetical protein
MASIVNTVTFHLPGYVEIRGNSIPMKKLIIALLILPAFAGCNEQADDTSSGTSNEKPAAKESDDPVSGEPWAPGQLMATADLAARINDGNAPKYVFNIGPSGAIAGSIEIGSTQEPENLQKLRTALSDLPKDAEVVVYCGCCPFQNCPNIRPAMGLLNEMGFEHAYLLNLSQNLKVDWIDHGYPMD